MITGLIQNTPPLRTTPPSRRATTTRKIHIMNPIGITMDPIVINVIVWVFVWPEFILSIDAVEANVWFVSMAVGKFTNVTFAIGAGFFV